MLALSSFVPLCIRQVAAVRFCASDAKGVRRLVLDGKKGGVEAGELGNGHEVDLTRS